MVKYECECGYIAPNKFKITRHLNNKISCTTGKDMKLVDVDKLKIYDSYNVLTQEEHEKKQRRLIVGRKSNAKRNALGKWSIEQLAGELLRNMINHAKKKEHSEPKWSEEDIVKLMQENNVYKIHNTILGTLEFPLQLTNGYYNTPSFDRIDNDKNYYLENVEIRPHFLNTMNKLTTDNIRELVKLREIPRNIQEFNNIAQQISDSMVSRTNGDYFYSLACSIEGRCTISDRKDFLFNSVEEFACFLIKLYINQGMRCAYSNVPIYSEINHKYKLSVERVDSTGHYSSDNIILVVIGLNGCPNGQYLNEYITEEQRKIAMNVLK